MVYNQQRSKIEDFKNDVNSYFCLLYTFAIKMSKERFLWRTRGGKAQDGKLSQGGQKKRYKDTLKASLKDFDIPMVS